MPPSAWNVYTDMGGGGEVCMCVYKDTYSYYGKENRLVIDSWFQHLLTVIFRISSKSYFSANGIIITHAFQAVVRDKLDKVN